MNHNQIIIRSNEKGYRFNSNEGVNNNYNYSNGFDKLNRFKMIKHQSNNINNDLSCVVDSAEKK